MSLRALINQNSIGRGVRHQARSQVHSISEHCVLHTCNNCWYGSHMRNRVFYMTLTPIDIYFKMERSVLSQSIPLSVISLIKYSLQDLSSHESHQLMREFFLSSLLLPYCKSRVTLSASTNPAIGAPSWNAAPSNEAQLFKGYHLNQALHKALANLQGNWNRWNGMAKARSKGRNMYSTRHKTGYWNRSDIFGYHQTSSDYRILMKEDIWGSVTFGTFTDQPPSGRG